MRRRKMYLAAILAAVMAFQAPVMVFATEEQVPVVDNNEEPGEPSEPSETETPATKTYGDVTITNDGWKPDDEAEEQYQVSAYENQSVTVDNVNSIVSSTTEDKGGSSNLPAVAAGNEGTVNVNGNVSSENTGAVLAEEGGTVNVKGDATSGNEAGGTVDAHNGGTVEIGGSVTNEGNGTDENGAPASFGVNVRGGSTVKVGGDVTADSGSGIMSAEGDNTVNVEGSVFSKGSPAIMTNNSSTITVGKNVSGNTGINIIIPDATDDVVTAAAADTASGTVAVLGTVKSTKENASVIVIETNETDKDKLVAALPEIIVGSLEGATESPEDYLWINGEDKMGDTEKDELREAVFSKFFYYIARDKFANATLDISGANVYENGWKANEKESLTVTVTAADGYEVSSLEGAEVVKNADGTYTVVVQRGKGIDINAIIKAIEKENPTTPDNKPTEKPTTPDNKPTEKPTTPDNKPTEKPTTPDNKPTENPTTPDKTPTNSAPVKTTPASTTVPTVVVPAYAVAQKQFQTAITAQIKALPANGNLKIDMKDYISFNKKTFEILSQRNDIDIEIIYTWQGKKYRVVIPAGYDILSLLDSNGYCGCLYLNSIFGSTEVTK